MANKTLHNKKALLEALEKGLGIVTTACKQVGISRVTYYDYYNTDEEFKKAVDELSNVALDFAESKLHKRVEKEDTTAIIFYLKTKGKKRGYIERTEVHQETTYKSLDINIIDTGVPFANSEKDIID